VRKLTVVALAVITAILAATPSPASAITRRRAKHIAVHALETMTPPSLAVFGFKQPLAAGTLVAEAGGPGALASNAQRLTAPTWFFWGDPTCGALFAHRSFMVLVDASTGAVIQRSLLWFPVINGSIAPWLASATAYRDPTYRVASTNACRGSTSTGSHGQTARASGSARPRPSRQARRWGARAAQFTPVITKDQLKNDCLVLIGDHQGESGGGEFDPGFAAMKKFASDVGLNAMDAPSSVAGLEETVGGLVRNPAQPCKDVFIYLAGHGIPARGAAYQEEYDMVQLGPDQGGDPGVILSWKQDANGNRVPDQMITPADLRKLMNDFAAQATFKLKIVSCFSGRFLPELTGQVNLIDAEASSGANQESYQYKDQIVAKDPSTGKAYVPDRYKNGVAQWKKKKLIPNTLNTGVEGDPSTHPDDFTFANIHGLEEWASSPQLLQETNFDLGKGKHLAAQLGLPFNFTAKVGYTTPEDLYNPDAHTLPPPPSVIGPEDFGAAIATGDPNTIAQASADFALWLAQQAAANRTAQPRAGGLSPSAPADGKITQVRVRGYYVPGHCPANPDSTCQTIFFQDLRPQPDGSVKVISTTQGFTLPTSAGTYPFTPVNFCVKAGDYVGLAGLGGYLQVLLSAPGALTDQFSGHGQDMNGAMFQPNKQYTETQLNMQMTVDPNQSCPS
jgi:hypothetical protein